MWIAFLLVDLKWLLNGYVMFSIILMKVFLIAIQNAIGLIWLESSFQMSEIMLLWC